MRQPLPPTVRAGQTTPQAMRTAIEPLESRVLFAALSLTKVGGFDAGGFESGAAEISAYDPDTARLFVVNAQASTVDILDLSDPTKPRQIAYYNTWDAETGPTGAFSGALGLDVDAATGLVYAVDLERGLLILSRQ